MFGRIRMLPVEFVFVGAVIVIALYRTKPLSDGEEQGYIVSVRGLLNGVFHLPLEAQEINSKGKGNITDI